MSLFKKPPHLPMTDVWIETGTYLGDGVASALAHGYQACASIERNRPVYERSVERFWGDARVHIMLGASPDILPSLINPRLHTTFWLDGHYSGSPGERDEKYGECPLLAELDIITAVHWERPPVILVDDAFMFLDWAADPNAASLAKMFRRSEWPLLDDIEQRFPDYEVTIHPTQDGTAPINTRGMLVVARNPVKEAS